MRIWFFTKKILKTNSNNNEQNIKYKKIYTRIITHTNGYYMYIVYDWIDKRIVMIIVCLVFLLLLNGYGIALNIFSTTAALKITTTILTTMTMLNAQSYRIYFYIFVLFLFCFPSDSKILFCFVFPFQHSNSNKKTGDCVRACGLFKNV